MSHFNYVLNYINIKSFTKALMGSDFLHLAKKMISTNEKPHKFQPRQV